MGVTYPAKDDLTKPQRKMLKILDTWGGDLPPDAEEMIGCRGEAFWNVIDALRRRELLTDGAHGTYILTPSGQAFVDAHKRGSAA